MENNPSIKYDWVVENFWTKLKKPIIGLAPMDGVTDAAFRRIVLKYGRPDVLFTEFVAVDGLNAGAARLLDAFIYDKSERPIVAQVFGANCDNFYKSAAIICALGFDGLDINMGCPDKDVVRQGGGASLIDRPHDAATIVAAAERGITDFANGKELADFELPENIVERVSVMNANAGREVVRRVIPLSIKTRIGTLKNTAVEWAGCLAEMGLANVTIHGRTLKQMYSGEADWEVIAAAAKIIKLSGTCVLGNGDVKSRADGNARALKYGLDGTLIGRAVLGNPWVFYDIAAAVEERLRIAIEHAVLYEKIFPERRFIEMRKHLAWYAHGFDDASALRAKLVHSSGATEAQGIIENFLARG